MKINTITVFYIKPFFIVKSINSFLSIRNNYRIQGIIFNFKENTKTEIIILCLSNEEIFLLIELNLISLFFITSNKTIKKKDNKNNFSYTKPVTRKCGIFFFNKLHNWRFFKIILKKIRNLKKKLNKFNHNILNCSLNIIAIKKLNSVKFHKYTVFKDLWKKGFTIVCGYKFGGTYLAYANKLEKVHSYVMVLVCLSYEYFKTIEIVSLGRLSCSTKKIGIISTINLEFYPIYFGIRWKSELP
ncbi:putative tetrameric tRNA splicing endonuclease [Guillardia theta]|uniref:tRNA-intron lyase n=1 Tax=Guillardia theta TaxID=55529 RepID=Q9AW86_GUITH|nr:putative tetrameric tRNA splicing endonuclease [Guillardia theta]CAC26983.1 putative tetrameric tRNA splicing endonuclease [Guillardia theta]